MVTLYLYRERSSFDLGYIHLVLLKDIAYKAGLIVNTSPKSLLDCLEKEEDSLFEAQKALAGQRDGFAVTADIYQKIIALDVGTTSQETESVSEAKPTQLIRPDDSERKNEARQSIVVYCRISQTYCFGIGRIEA